MMLGFTLYGYRIAGVAQLAERDLAKVEVVGSNPIARSTLKEPRKFRGSYFWVNTKGCGIG